MYHTHKMAQVNFFDAVSSPSHRKWQLTQPPKPYRIAPTYTIFLLACGTSALVLRSFLISKEHTHAGHLSFPTHYVLHHSVSTYAGPSPC